MAETAAKPRRSRIVSHRGTETLRAKLDHELTAAGYRTRRDMLDILERYCRWLRRCVHAGESEIHRTDYQLARALGVQVDGAKDAHRKLSMQRKRALSYLAAIGWVEAWEPRYDGRGEGQGWVVRLTARGCSSVGYSVTRRRPSPSAAPSARSSWRAPCSSSSHEVLPPSGAPLRSAPTGPPSVVRRGGTGAPARARYAAESVDASQPYSGPYAPAALAGFARLGGAGALESAWRRGAPLWAVLRGAALWLGLPPRLSRRAEAQAERSIGQIDRLFGPGAGLAELLQLMEAGGQAGYVPGAEVGTRRPQSIGFFVPQLRRCARRSARDHRRPRC
jgi:hypothetical protein